MVTIVEPGIINSTIKLTAGIIVPIKVTIDAMKIYTSILATAFLS